MKEQKVYKSIPTSETGSTVTNTTKNGSIYLITQCIEKSRFTLWRVLDSGFEKIEISNNPLNLEIPWQK